MARFYFSFIGIFILIGELFTQTLTLIQELPEELVENSGMAVYGDSIFYFHNDSGHPNELFRFSLNSGRLTKFNVPNTTNVDWEELAKDDEGNLYIGDFGNNSNNRQDLKIYKINNPETNSETELDAQEIHISYTNQNAFPPQRDGRYFDMEAMLWFKDSLYLFSKNRTEPYDGKCYMYVLPAMAGTYELAPVDSFLFPDDDYRLGWITAADISKDKQTVALLSSYKMHVFSGDFSKTRFFEGEYTEVNFKHLSQKEAIAFKEDGYGVFITDEKFQIGPNLYEYNFKTQELTHTKSPIKRKVYSDAIDFGGNPENCEVSIYDLTGKLHYQVTTNSWVHLGFLKPQIYIIHVKTDARTEYFRWVRAL